VTRLETEDTKRNTAMDNKVVVMAVMVICKPVFFGPLTIWEMAQRATSFHDMAAAKAKPLVRALRDCVSNIFETTWTCSDMVKGCIQLS